MRKFVPLVSHFPLASWRANRHLETHPLAKTQGKAPINTNPSVGNRNFARYNLGWLLKFIFITLNL